MRPGAAAYVPLRHTYGDAPTQLDFDVVMQRVIDMPRYGWHSMDTHLHFDRGEPENDRRIAQLLAAEDIELGHILAAKSAKRGSQSSSSRLSKTPLALGAPSPWGFRGGARSRLGCLMSGMI